jgi:hypothetical protein
VQEGRPAVRRTPRPGISSCRHAGRAPQLRALRSSPGEPANLPSKAEFDGVNYTTLARAVRTGDRERVFLEVDVELPDASDLLDVGEFEFDHLTSPPTESEKIFTKSSAFWLLGFREQLFELLNLGGVEMPGFRKLRKELRVYLLLKGAHEFASTWSWRAVLQ